MEKRHDKIVEEGSSEVICEKQFICETGEMQVKGKGSRIRGD